MQTNKAQSLYGLDTVAYNVTITKGVVTTGHLFHSFQDMAKHIEDVVKVENAVSYQNEALTPLVKAQVAIHERDLKILKLQELVSSSVKAHYAAVGSLVNRACDAEARVEELEILLNKIRDSQSIKHEDIVKMIDEVLLKKSMNEETEEILNGNG